MDSVDSTSYWKSVIYASDFIFNVAVAVVTFLFQMMWKSALMYDYSMHVFQVVC